MEKLLELLFSAESIAVVAGIFIFCVAIILFAKKLINFLMTIFLLVFCIAAGLAIANYDYFKKAYQDEQSEEREQVKSTWEQIKEKVQGLYDQLFALNEELKDTQIHVEAFRSSAMLEMSELSRQVNQLQTSINQENEKLLSLESNLKILIPILENNSLETTREEDEKRTHI